MGRAGRAGRAASSPIEGFTGARARLIRSAALHYKGQSFDLVVPVPDGPIDERMVATLEEAFGAEHERTYGHRAGIEEPVELVAIQVVGQGLREGPSVPERMVSSRPEPVPGPPRRVYFGERGWIETPVVRRSDLARSAHGPLIVEEYDATCVVPPGARCRARPRGLHRDRARDLMQAWRWQTPAIRRWRSSRRTVLVVMVGLVPTIQPSEGAGAS